MENRVSVHTISCLFLMALILALGLSSTSTYAGTYEYTIQSGDYEIVDAGDGYQEINMDGFGQLLQPGKPKLPSKIFAIAIPPGVTADSVEVTGVGLVELPGTYKIAAAPMVSSLSATEGDIEEIRVEYEQIRKQAYASDAAYPSQEGMFKNQGAYRKYNLVQVRYSPFYYQAKSGKLFFYSSAVVAVSYSQASAITTEEEQVSEPAGLSTDWLPEAEERASEILINYEEALQWHPGPLEGEIDSQIGLYEFVIVTTDDLVDAVQPLVNWEKSKGRTVYVATTSWIDTNYSGADLERRIRYFLRDKYPSGEWGILKVCIVGDHATIPMRMCHPAGQGGSSYPTDLYYAELTSTDSASWDDDWDGYFGEQDDDSIDFIQEVDVGRIPWSDAATVESICTKMAEYEYSTDMTFKSSILMPAAFFWTDTDNAELMEEILDMAHMSAWNDYKIYERSTTNPNRWSSYSADAYMVSTATTPVLDEWTSSNHYGFVNWAGHGSSTSASYHCGDGYSCWNFINRNDCASLNDDYPAIIFADACSNSYPENESIGRRMLKQGAVAFVGATRNALGAHGWNDPSDGSSQSLDYWFTYKVTKRQASVGWALKWALRKMYTDYGWDNSWFQMFEWSLYSNPDLWMKNRPSLPNLDYLYRTGWDYPIVPRSAGGATSTWCPVTSTLPGNTSNTYFNWTWENNGAIDAPTHRTTFYVDGTWFFWSEASLSTGSSKYYANIDSAKTVTGGRHTVYYYIDSLDQVWETSESDNCWGHQFVWSPYGLSDDTPVTRSAPPDSDAWGCAPGGTLYFNNDGFSFLVQASWPNKYWSAVGVVPYSSSADYDVRLWDIGDYTGSEGGFGGGYLEYSSWSGSASNFVIVNDNTAPAGTYYAGVINDNDGTGNFHIEAATSTKIFSGTNGPYSMTSTSVLDMYEYYIDPAGDYWIKLEQTSGTCDLGMSLYDDETVHCQKSEYMTGGYANSNGDGEDEFKQVTIPDSGYHGLVVWKADSSDYSKTSTYTIKVGKCATPGTSGNPVPADGAPDVSVNTDLDWDDCTDTEHYEVWLKEGTGASVMLGTTEESNWTLGTLNELTTYTWVVKAVNFCDDYWVWGCPYPYWSFTTEDNTPPTPNPMTWATVPYEKNTSSISMKATTASDPTTPITYFFDFYNSPTGGTGGTDSAWQASTSYTDSVLSTNHQYGYRVRARDGSANTTSYSTPVSYDYTDIETPTGITFGTITSTSIRARSTNKLSGLTRGSSGLYIYNETAGTNSGWKQDNYYWTSTPLSVNTQYEFRAKARNGDANETRYCAPSYRYTLANLPRADGFSNVTQTSIRANWTANGNPKGTEYYCENTTAGTNSGWTTSTYWNSTGLKCGNSYSFQVKARNGNRVETKWTSLGDQKTLPCVEPCEGDFDDDGDVDGSDLAVFATDFGRTDCCESGVEPCEGDFDKDCDVDGSDLAVFATDFGRTDCPK